MKKQRAIAFAAALAMLLSGCSAHADRLKNKKMIDSSEASAVTWDDSSEEDNSSSDEGSATETETAVTETPDSSTGSEAEQELPTRHTIDVENIMQTPELPYGCEIVSLTIVLQYLGFNVDKMDMADNYLETIYFWRADDELYGADPYEAFPGDPRDKVVTGCFAPVIVRSAEKFFFDRKSNCYPVNTSETPLDDLLHTYIDNDKPVIIWVTSSNLHEIEYKNSWKTADGRTINFPSYQHCLVLTGYDTDVGVVYVADPLKGNIAYDKWLFNVRYEELGMQSLVIEEGLE